MVPRDEEAVLARQPPLKRRLMRTNTVKLRAPSLVNVPQNVLPMTVEELLRRIDGYLTEKGEGYLGRGFRERRDLTTY